MFLKVAAVEQADLGEQHRRHERHLSQLLETALHPKLVPFLLRHEGHDAANIGPHVTGPHQRHRRHAPLALSCSRSVPALSQH